ncbi:MULTISPECIES: methionyl-tRNA formyltransferase [unclassified Olsenella]|uniref:methionyl-tRNA formyltransferase n=1 Tax=unclassified Olsenella TaxID=2638792 RepID=UPI000231EEA3|nr:MULTISPECIES: methionyl-tRNA formyltransferase [unclassified Olsenella]EHF01916.1 methionyl-tRNA formyltransferase [Olsenella sp. oral taxon 809 str. F0356]KXB62461.1 methionyl-tRNA formyltransferase [Olsenella sp. DNF00959]
MRLAFMGTPDFAVPSLRKLAAVHEVALVVTRPDAVRGRGRALVPSAVKSAALELGLEVIEARRVTPELLDRLRDLDLDAVAVAAFGCILPDELLGIARMGCVNVHGSLLPRWRGAAPIQRAVLEGDERAGISIMRIVHELDAGAYCRQASVEVGEKPCATVMSELAELGADELLLALAQMEDGTARWVDQDESQVSYARKIDKREMLLDPADGRLANRRRVQASLDAAPARMALQGKGVRVLDARVSGEALSQGGVLVRKGRVFLGCSDGAIELLRVKPDGKREMDVSAWAAGLQKRDLGWERA